MHRHARATIALALGLLAAAAAARPPGTNCADSPIEAGGLDQAPRPLFPDLPPGGTVRLDGTDAASNSDLVGATIKNLSLAYSWNSSGGSAIGVLTQQVSNATGSDKCVLQHQVQTSATASLRVCALRLTHLLYPAPHPVYAEYRTDTTPAGDVAGRRASRSDGAGSTVRFKLRRCLNPGEYSEALILVTTAPQVARDAYVRLEAEDGSLSAPLKVYNTLLP